MIDLSGKSKAEADQLATLIDGTVTALPKGKIKPAVDILIILGKEVK